MIPTGANIVFPLNQGNDSIIFYIYYYSLESTKSLTKSIKYIQEKQYKGNFLAMQQLRLLGSTPGWGTNIPEASRCGKKNK